MTDAESRKLEASANRILRKAGFTAAGRPKTEVKPKQCEFERKNVLIACGGMTRPRTWYRK